MFDGPFQHSIVKNAINKDLVSIEFVNIRDFGIGKHRVVDDKPYGGGVGMVMRVDVLEKAISHTLDPKLSKSEQKVILLDPHGPTYNQKKALELSQLHHVILVCGHYEGVDERIKEMIDEELSIGDFIVTGGEIPAMLVADSVARLVKGVLKDDATRYESFSHLVEDTGVVLEHPHYTKPRKHNENSVPEVLLSGDHKKIGEWKAKQSPKGK